MSTRAKFIFILIPVIVLIGLGLLKFRPWQGAESGAPAAAAGPRTMPVEVVKVKQTEFRGQLVFNGSLVARHAIEIRSEVSGRLESVNFQSGADVEAGEVLAMLDTRELEAQRRAQQSELRVAEADLTRFEQLYESGGYTERDLAEAQSRKEVLAAGLFELDVMIDKATLRAPFSGTLGLRLVSPGQLIESSTMLTTLQDLDLMYLDFVLPERNRGIAVIGNEVAFTAGSGAQEFPATIQAIDPQIDRETRSLMVRAVVDNAERELLPGNFARVQVPVVASDVIVVPSVAVVRSLGGVFVYRVESGKAVRADVEVGRRTADQVEILAGLQSGDLVVTIGVQALRDGVPVAITRTVEQ